MLGWLADWWYRIRRRGRVAEDKHAFLPFDIYLTTGAGSLELFAGGVIDEFRFFQRAGVPPNSKVEFLSRLEPDDAGTENYRAYGLFRLRPEWAIPIERPGQVQKLWEVLNKGYGLARVPDPETLCPGGFRAYDPRRGDPPAQGQNWLRASKLAKGYARPGRRRFAYTEVLEILRREMGAREKIAWIEDCFDEDLPLGEIVHRYYLGSNEQAYLVRHHWERGKLLYRAETSADALEICNASGHFQRTRRHAA